MKNIAKRFINYAKYNTASDPKVETCPSTKSQFSFGEVLVEELKDIGVSNVYQSKDGYIYGEIPKNVEGAPAIGFIAHMDTSPDFSSVNVNPKYFTYEGGDIELKGRSIKVKEFPFLNNLVGEELITADGTTLLGADDKAGITIIMEGAKYLLENPDIKHGTVKIGFTPDEEIGRGAKLFDVNDFACDFAYTFDGGPLGELEYENFNGASVVLTVEGVNIHPGSAKDIMVNSILVANEFISMLPSNETPATTEGYEGFYHVMDFQGTVEKTVVEMIIRDHDREIFEKRKKYVRECADKLNEKYKGLVKCDIEDSYYNMREVIEKNMHIVDLARESMEEVGIKPLIQAIRGGTDGATLSYMGLPCPNLFTGGYNFHGPYELIPVAHMEKGVELMIKIVERACK